MNASATEKEKERRSTEDRRQSDGGPPDGWKERRRSVERRLPVVGALTEAEWLHHFEIFHRALGRPLPLPVTAVEERECVVARNELTTAD